MKSYVRNLRIQATAIQGRSKSKTSVFRAVWSKEYLVVFLYLTQVSAMNVGALGRLFSMLLKPFVEVVTGCCISAKARIQVPIFFPHPTGVVVGEGAVIGPGCHLFQGVTIGQKTSEGIAKYPTIGENVTIYANSVVLGGIKLGTGSTIGPGSIVMTEVEENSLYVSSLAVRKR